MSGILDLVLSQVAGGQLDSVGKQLGIPPEIAGRAVEAALPALLAGLAKNATSSPQGAAALAGAIDRDHDGSMLDNVGGLIGMLGGGSSGGGGLGGLLGGASSSRGGGLGGLLGAAGSLFGGRGGGGAAPAPAAANGAGILKHVFGDRQSSVESAVGTAAGIDAAKAGQLLMVLAPIVMGALGKMKRSQNLDADGLAGLLGQERDQLQKAAPGVGGLMGMLDQDGDGDIKDDLSQLGAGLLGSFLKGRARIFSES